MNKRRKGIDFISDSHGRYDDVLLLLKKAGYVFDNDGIPYHPERIAFFLGDFIDKGNQVMPLFFMIKQMVEKKYAKAILGNHELNFLLMNILSKKKTPIRKNSDKNLLQISKSLDLLVNKEDNFKFLYSLPIFYETNYYRAVHACWHKESIKKIKNVIINNKISEDILIKIYEDNSLISSLEILMKGFEVDISPNFYCDQNNIKCFTSRLNWWSNDSVFESLPENVRLDKIDKQYFYNDKKMVFFGHFQRKGIPTIQANKAICLDYSHNGYLTMYRYSYEKDLIENNLIYIKNERF